MRLANLLLLTILLMSSAAFGADSTERSSPLDNNAACMEHTTDASSGNCVVMGEDSPRHAYPPRISPTSNTPAPAPAAAAPIVRRSAAGK